jgi:hypothetical protein
MISALLKKETKAVEMSKCQVLWNRGEDGKWIWNCTKYWLNHNVTFRASAETCYHFECRGRRELPQYRIDAVEEVKKEDLVEIEEPAQVQTCAWFRCDQPVAPNKLRHCSEICRKRQNRWDYKQRQKAKKAEEP